MRSSAEFEAQQEKQIKVDHGGETPERESKESSGDSTGTSLSFLLNINTDTQAVPQPLTTVSVPGQSYAIPPDVANHLSNISTEINFPEDYCDAMKEAAKQGFLYSFLCTLTEEFVTEELKKRHYSKDQIYWINQSIRALTLLVGGASVARIVISPVATFLLIKILGMEESTANNVTMGIAIGVDVVTNPIGTAATLGIFAIGIGSSFFASKLAKEIYHSGSEVPTARGETSTFVERSYFSLFNNPLLTENMTLNPNSSLFNNPLLSDNMTSKTIERPMVRIMARL